ncbi:polysaccharide deacetylase family protein [Conexibacter sp. CPCC 206217]|uniref:polysaccharide deacetylase family protein n=1 Tax=Conexibacter sp. CPCC 206217 TaxID=3064574 RepID=UPI002715FB41|nr:polysaccharide deacetylase family protein [Conexibacter sp. CPCC 206217]MDO8212060.1 polysaccharide deacetylase family protein [Conexibacter sp. CPCC 206217]
MSERADGAGVTPGSVRRAVRWPHDEAIAMTVGVALEAFDRHSQVRTEGRGGERDLFSLSYAEYGVRVGVWRLLEVFAEEEVTASFSISGKVAADHPATIRAVAGAGHDLIGHGWVNDRLMADASETDERDMIRRTLDAIETAGGRRPTGWASPGNMSSERTLAILQEEGVTFTGDDASDDVPFVEQVGGTRMAVLPKANIDANDLLQWVLPKNAPGVFADSFVATFDTLHAEGLRGRPGWADVVLHCHMAGRPTFVPTLRAVLRHVRARERVWWTRKSDLAAWTLEQDFTR